MESSASSYVYIHGLTSCSTVVVALWAYEEGKPVAPELRLVVDGKYDGGVKVDYQAGPTWNQLQG